MDVLQEEDRSGYIIQCVMHCMYVGNVCMDVCMYVHMYAIVSVYQGLILARWLEYMYCMYVCMYCMYLCTYVLYVCVYVCMYVCAPTMRKSLGFLAEPLLAALSASPAAEEPMNSMGRPTGRDAAAARELGPAIHTSCRGRLQD